MKTAQVRLSHSHRAKRYSVDPGQPGALDVAEAPSAARCLGSLAFLQRGFSVFSRVTALSPLHP